MNFRALTGCQLCDRVFPAVFLSYASQDSQAAQRICGTLRAAGIEVWFDRSELRGGDAWDQSIRRQIKSCALFIPVVCKNTHDRDEGYFRLEWKLAVDRCHLMAADRAFLLPVVIDDTCENDERVPERFREVQWTRLPAGETSTAFVEHIRRLLAPANARAHKVGHEPMGSLPAARLSTNVSTSPHWSRGLPIAVSLLIVGTLAYLTIDRSWISKSLAISSSTVAPHPAPVAFSPPPHSIAVLPFTNLTGNTNQEYFSDGISEELINALSRVDSLEVIARTSSFSFKGQSVDISTIARKLNVGAILEGSVRRSGNTVRISVQLINAVTGFNLWSRTYDRKMADILKVQTEVATMVAQQLAIRLTNDDAARIEVGGTRIPAAYDSYLRGVRLYNEADTDEASSRAALAAANEAVTLDPGYAAAYALRANVLFWIIGLSTDLRAREALTQRAIASARRAVALAPEYGEAHLVLAMVRMRLLDFAGAAPEFDRALALAPGNAHVQYVFGSFADALGHFKQAMIANRRAIRLDPQNFWAYLNSAGVFADARRFGAAQSALHDAEALEPNSKALNSSIADVLLASGETKKASLFCESRRTPLDDDYRRICLALSYHALNRQVDAERELKQLQASDGDTAAFAYAEIYAQWGNRVAALRWLAKAERLRDPSLQWLKVHWALDPIRGEPQFKAIEARMNFPP